MYDLCGAGRASQSADPPLHRAKEIKIFVTFVTVFTPQSSRLGFACRATE